MSGMEGEGVVEGSRGRSWEGKVMKGDKSSGIWRPGEGGKESFSSCKAMIHFCTIIMPLTLF